MKTQLNLCRSLLKLLLLLALVELPRPVSGAELDREIAAVQELERMDSDDLVETWRDLSKWNAAGLQVVDGKLFALPGAPNPAYANHAFVLGAPEEARILFSINVPEGGGEGSGFCFVGINSDAPNSQPLVNAPNVIGMGVEFGVLSPGNNHALFDLAGVLSHDTTNYLPGGVLTGVINIDTNLSAFV